MSAHTTSRTAPHQDALGLRKQITPGRPQPALTASIAACRCGAPVRAGLYLLNGDWDAAHKAAQDIETPLGAHWHALVHRHEPDYPNSKYWLSQVGNSAIYPRLAEAARTLGHEEVLRRGQWDPDAFTDCFAKAQGMAWARDLDALEQQLLLDVCLADAG